MVHLRRISFTLALCLGVACGSVLAQNPPAAPVTNTTDIYFGVAVGDPYRYMENLSDPLVAGWMKAQSEFTTAQLDRIAGRKELLKRIQTLDEAVPARVSGIRRLPHERHFYLKQLPSDNTPKLYRREGLKGKETLLVDPESLAKATGKPQAINYYEPTWDGRYVACGIAAAGSEDTVIHVVETATGNEVDKPIDRARFGGISWRPDGRSFFYNRLQKMLPGMPATEREQNSCVYLHTIGADAETEPAVFGPGISPLVQMDRSDQPFIRTSPDSRFAFGVIEHGTKDEKTLYVAPLATVGKPNTPWRKVFDIDDDVTEFSTRGNDVFLMTHKDAPRYKIIQTTVARPDLAAATTVIPAGDAVVTALTTTKDALYVRERDGAVSRLWRAPFRGRAEEVPLPAKGTLWLTAPNTMCDGILLGLTTWTSAVQVYGYDPRTKKLENTGLQPLGPFDAPEDMVSEEVGVPSEDGAMVPLSIMHKRGVRLDGTNPTLLLGYGAYGISLDPRFDPRMLGWYERGCVYAIAHVRGGGERGDDWYRAGYKRTKPNTWKDFIACARYLVDHKYTSPQRLAGIGRSAGGILIGRAITERPELFAAAISEVGCSDMLRLEFTANGVPNIPEFGTVKTEDGFRALYEMSSYHHVVDGMRYPAVMLVTGINDPRVEPWEVAKMAARLQAATASGKPVLLRVDYEAGHGVGTMKKQSEKQTADEWTFLLWQMGVPEFQPSP